MDEENSRPLGGRREYEILATSFLTAPALEGGHTATPLPHRLIFPTTVYSLRMSWLGAEILIPSSVLVGGLEPGTFWLPVHHVTTLTTRVLQRTSDVAQIEQEIRKELLDSMC